MVTTQTYADDSRASGEIIEKLNAVCGTLGQYTEAQVLVAFVERTATVVASMDGVAESDADQLRSELAIVLMRDCRKALQFYRARGDA